MGVESRVFFDVHIMCLNDVEGMGGGFLSSGVGEGYA